MNILARYRRGLTLAALASSLLLIGSAAMSSMCSAPNTPRKPAGPATVVPKAEMPLPLPPAELAAAADIARRFIAAYGTYRYDESPHTYMARLHPLAGDQLYQQLTRAAQDPAVLTDRQRDHTIVTADATITTTRTIQPDTITFLVTGHQHITTTNRPAQDTQTFAVTLTKHHTHWTVATLTPTTTDHTGQTGQTGQTEDEPA